MKKYSYPHKDKHILIYTEIEETDGIVKKYIHPIGTRLKAYVRSLSSQEQNSDSATQNNVTTEFVINYREAVNVAMFIEFKNKVYYIDSADPLEFYDTELKLRGYPITPNEYKDIEWAK